LRTYCVYVVSCENVKVLSWFVYIPCKIHSNWYKQAILQYP
jgi:hypothetical protein